VAEAYRFVRCLKSSDSLLISAFGFQDYGFCFQPDFGISEFQRFRFLVFQVSTFCFEFQRFSVLVF
jgi:hypothetical protein